LDYCLQELLLELTDCPEQKHGSIQPQASGTASDAAPVATTPTDSKLTAFTANAAGCRRRGDCHRVAADMTVLVEEIE